MKEKQNIKTIMRIVGTVVGGTLLATLTLLIVYAFFWLLKLISTGIITVADFVISFIVANWASGLGIIAMLMVGMIELELLVLPKLSSIKNSKKTASDSDDDDDDDDATDEALAYLQSFEPDPEDED